MKMLEPVTPFQCPQCDGTGQGCTYTPQEYHAYTGLESALPATHQASDYTRCPLCQGARVILLAAYQMEETFLMSMGLMIAEPIEPDHGPEVRNVTLVPRNKSERYP